MKGAIFRLYFVFASFFHGNEDLVHTTTFDTFLWVEYFEFVK